MTLPLFQDWHWPRIRKLVVREGVECAAAEGGLVERLRGGGDAEEAIVEWAMATAAALGERYARLGDHPALGEREEELSNATLLVMEFTRERARLAGMLERARERLVRGNDPEDARAIVGQMIGNAASELRDQVDARALAAASGREMSAQRLRVLRLVDHLDRAVQQALDGPDVETLAALTGEAAEALESNPFRVRRYRAAEARAALVMRMDEVEQRRKGAQPRLPTNHWNNIAGPGQLRPYLDELALLRGAELLGVDEATTRAPAGVAQAAGDDAEWVEDLLQVIGESRAAHPAAGDDSDGSPGIEEGESGASAPTFFDRAMELDVTEQCMRGFPEHVRLGMCLLWNVQAGGERRERLLAEAGVELDDPYPVAEALVDEDQRLSSGEPVTWAALRRLGGLSQYRLMRAIERAERAFVECVKALVLGEGCR